MKIDFPLLLKLYIQLFIILIPRFHFRTMFGKRNIEVRVSVYLSESLSLYTFKVYMLQESTELKLIKPVS